MTTTADLQSLRFEADDAMAANELFQRNGWTDGLPIVPPTEEPVRACLEWAGMEPGEVVGIEPVRGLPITAEKVAINAVMAGCLPPYLPVVVAALQAMCAEEFLLHGTSASTGGSAPLLIVNGPVRIEIGMNARHNALGNGNRANATIGRALRLLLINMLGCIPGEMDRSTLGHPGKYSFCLAEDEEDTTWTPLAQERGIPFGTSAVTVLSAESPRQFMNEWTDDPEEICETLAAEIRANMLTYSIWPGNYVALFPKQLRDVLTAAGWSKRDIREYVYRRARVRRGDWRSAGKAKLSDRGDDNQEYCALRTPDDLLVVAAGGPAGGFGAVIPPWLGNRSYAVTRPVGVCIDCD
jgi:hypothetical protein